MRYQYYELSSDSLDLCKGKLTPGITATWGEIAGNIETQKDLVSYISAHGTAAWGSISGSITDQTDLIEYTDRFATTAWVQEQGYLTEHQDLTGYATESWVSSQGYITTSALSGYATESWVSAQGYLVSDDLSQYATRQWVTGRGYITTSALSGYATESWVSAQGYITSAALSGYATESWVSSQGYASAADLSGYIQFDLSHPLSSIEKTLPFYSSNVGLFPVYQSFSSTWVNIEMTTNPVGWVSMGLVCYDENGGSEIWRNRFITENDMSGYVSRSYVNWRVQADGYPLSIYTLADENGNYTIGSLDDTTQAFTGIKVSGSQAGAYTVISSGLQYQESFSPFVTESTLDSVEARLSALETNYGDALSITNNILS